MQQKNWEHQEALQERQLRAQEELQKRQQIFQAAMQERNYQLMGQLQREMAMIKFEMDSSLQRSNFQNQIAMWERTAFIQNVWPLIDTPQNIVGRLKDYGSPMSVILSGAADGAYDGLLSNVADFFNTTYIGESLIYYYNQGWKPEMKKRDGNAQRDAIHQAMKGLPTLLLLPVFSEGLFELRIAFWGWGDMTPPQTKKAFSVDVKKLNMQILRELALEWKDRRLPPNPAGRMKTIHENLAIAREEEGYREQLRQDGCSKDEIERICAEAYSDRYSFRDLGDDLVRERNEILSAPLKITAAMISDAYNLGNGILPKLPGYMKELSDDMRQMFWPQVESFFEDFLQSQNDLNRPLTQTLLARSFAAADRPDLAKKYRQQAMQFLAEAYSNPGKWVADEHWNAILMLHEDYPKDRKNPDLLESAVDATTLKQRCGIFTFKDDSSHHFRRHYGNRI